MGKKNTDKRGTQNFRAKGGEPVPASVRQRKETVAERKKKEKKIVP